MAAEIDARDWALVERVAADLLETMHSFPRCVGLAAPQIGEPVRIIAVDVSLHPKGDPNAEEILLVNPRVVSGTRLRGGARGLPERARVHRRRAPLHRGRDRGADRDGKPWTIEASGFEARALQHEIDHLDGLLFLDRVDSLTRDVFRRKNYG